MSIFRQNILKENGELTTIGLCYFILILAIVILFGSFELDYGNLILVLGMFCIGWISGISEERQDRIK